MGYMGAWYKTLRALRIYVPTVGLDAVSLNEADPTTVSPPDVSEIAWCLGIPSSSRSRRTRSSGSCGDWHGCVDSRSLDAVPWNSKAIGGLKIWH